MTGKIGTHTIFPLVTFNQKGAFLVIRHQTVCEDLDGVLAAMLGETNKIGRSVIIDEENNFVSISALCDVVRDTGCNRSGNSGHVVCREMCGKNWVRPDFLKTVCVPI